MKPRYFMQLLILRFLFLTAFSHAQDNKPADPIQKLMRLSGSWVSKCDMMYEGENYDIVYHVVFKPVSDGHGLLGEESFSGPVLGIYHGSSLIGFDPYDRKIHWYTVDNTGTTHDHVGNWTDPDQFEMVHKSTRDKKAYHEKLSIRFTGKDQYEVIFIATLDGKVIETLEGTFKREILK
jgi:hypothetical protein